MIIYVQPVSVEHLKNLAELRFLVCVLGFELTAGGIIRLVGLAGGGEAVGKSPWECETIRKNYDIWVVV